jgi:CheY-like chemotaxis protein
MEPKPRILVVDDEYVSLTKLTLLLSQYGEVDQATSGEQALELFDMALEENCPYSLVTMDISMNGKSGFETIDEINKREMGAHSLDIIMITAMSDEQSINRSAVSGCQKILIKPLQKNKLFETMAELGWSVETRRESCSS